MTCIGLSDRTGVYRLCQASTSPSASTEQTDDRRGGIAMLDPTVMGVGINWLAVFSELSGYDFMTAFSKTEPTLTADRSLLVEWVARGKYPVGLSAMGEQVMEFVASGAPLTSIIPKEGTYVSAGAGVVSAVAKAAHPDAAKVFINRLLSQEGQTIHNKVQQTPGLRRDVSTDHVPPINVTQPGVNYVTTEDEQFLLALPQNQKVARAIFGPLLK